MVTMHTRIRCTTKYAISRTRHINSESRVRDNLEIYRKCNINVISSNGRTLLLVTSLFTHLHLRPGDLMYL